MLSLSSRTARLNQDYKGKSKEKDGEVTKLLTFGLDEIEVTAEEVGAITGNPYIAAAMIDNTKDGPRPMFAGFKPHQWDEDIVGAAVEVRLRGGALRKFTDCKVTKIRFAVNESGVILMSCKVLTAPALDAGHAKFIADAGELVDAELHGSAKSDQGDLGLNTHGEGEQPEGTEKRKPGRPRKSDAHVN